MQKPIALSFLALSLFACGPTSTLPSTRDPDFAERLQRIAIVVYWPDKPGQESRLRDGLTGQLEARGLATISGSTLDGGFKRRIASFKPDALLVVTAAAKAGKARFDISLYPHGTSRKRIWQTTVEPDADGAPALSELPAAVAEQLATDRMI